MSFGLMMMVCILFTLLIVILWLIDGIDEDNKNEIKFKNIHDYIKYHYEYLLQVHFRLSNPDILKKLQLKLDKLSLKNYEVENNLDDIVDHYNNIQKYVVSRDVCLVALKYRKWKLPNNHADITKNIEDLMTIHSNLGDNIAARRTFEYLMKRRDYSRFVC